MRVMLCNCPPDAAPDLARALVERRLAACVNIIGGVRSVYRWEGKLCDDAEATLLIKTSRPDDLERELALLHPYSVPEILALSVDEAHSHRPYLSWVRGECEDS